MKKPAEKMDSSAQEEQYPAFENDLLPVRRIQVVHVNEEEDDSPLYLKQDPYMKHSGPKPYAA